MGYEADDLLSIFDTLNEDDIWQYRYPSDADLHTVGVRGIYLANYVRWDPKAQHELMIEKYQYRGARFARTFDTYDHVDCYNFMDLHDHIKMIKHGYSKVTDHACREIRHGRISRDQAEKLVYHYERQPLYYSDLFFEWLKIDPRGFQFILEQHRRIQSDCVVEDVADADIDGFNFERKKILNSLSFLQHEDLDLGRRKYFIIGKGYPD